MLSGFLGGPDGDTDSAQTWRNRWRWRSWIRRGSARSSQRSIDDGSASVALGVGVHLTLSALFGVIFSLQVLSPLFFPALQDANQPFEVLVHLVYGQALAVIFLSRGVRAAERRFEWR